MFFFGFSRFCVFRLRHIQSYDAVYKLPLIFYSLRLNLRTSSFNIRKFCVLPTVNLCVLRGSENKQPLFLYTALTDWFL